VYLQARSTDKLSWEDKGEMGMTRVCVGFD
jgi:hypothetical protein